VKSAAAVYLKRGRANPVWRGHPWVFSGAIERTVGRAEPGDVADVYDADQRLIGVGFLNPRSQIAVRMLTRGPVFADDGLETASHGAEPAIAALLASRIEDAARLRRRLGLPSAETTAYRLVNSEGDGLPGLVVDVYGPVAAVQYTALGMKRCEAAITAALKSTLAGTVTAIVEVGAGSFAQVEGFTSVTRVLSGDPAVLEGPIPCLENGIQLLSDLRQGQKTGLFLDQRENRRRLGALCKGARVLDVYCYVGGFGLNALRSGATEVTAVDMSARALARVNEHAELNGLGPLTAVEADGFRFLEGVTPHSYDVVVVDPPKFARAQKDLAAAQKGYQRLNALALNAVKPGGLLATCSCSQLVEQEAFERLLAAAAQDAGRRVAVLESASQGPDHPVPPAFPEGRYLKFVLLGVT